MSATLEPFDTLKVSEALALDQRMQLSASLCLAFEISSGSSGNKGV